MSDSYVTKLAFADSLKKLMGKKNFSQISVRDIAGNCGLTRQSFYYHFRDKYDLMNWIYSTETVNYMITGSMDRRLDGLKELCMYMRRNRAFYVNALNTSGQNSFQEFLHDYIRDFISDGLVSTANVEENQENNRFIAEVTAIIFVGFTLRWINGEMKEDLVEYIVKLKGLFNGSILQE